jgi:hypothetical protein
VGKSKNDFVNCACTESQCCNRVYHVLFFLGLKKSLIIINVNINTSILGDSSISLAASTNLYDPNTATSLAVAFSDPGNSAYSGLGVIGIVVGAALIFVAFIMFIIQI